LYGIFPKPTRLTGVLVSVKVALEFPATEAPGSNGPAAAVDGVVGRATLLPL
jgi:hypothetical protein